jgi:hypothetical protein
MKKLTRNQWIMIGVGVVVLFVVYNYIKNRGFYLEFEKPEEKSGAMGKTFCQCQGQPNGYCFNWSPWTECCARKCVKKIHSTWD